MVLGCTGYRMICGLFLRPGSALRPFLKFSGLLGLFFPTLGVGLLQLFSSPGTLLLARSTPRSSLECPTPKCPWSAPLECFWSAQPHIFFECPTPWSAQPQNVPTISSPRVSLECPKRKSPWSAQSESLQSVRSQSLRVSPKCPAPETPWGAQPPDCPAPECTWSAQRQSISAKRGWGMFEVK